MSSNPVHSEVFLIQHYVIMFVSAKGQLFYLGIPVSSINKTNRHDMTAILLKVVLNTINQPNHTIL
jgi:hypothetical protein